MWLLKGQTKVSVFTLVSTISRPVIVLVVYTSTVSWAPCWLSAISTWHFVGKRFRRVWDCLAFYNNYRKPSITQSYLISKADIIIIIKIVHEVLNKRNKTRILANALILVRFIVCHAHSDQTVAIHSIYDAHKRPTEWHVSMTLVACRVGCNASFHTHNDQQSRSAYSLYGVHCTRIRDCIANVQLFCSRPDPPARIVGVVTPPPLWNNAKKNLG